MRLKAVGEILEQRGEYDQAIAMLQEAVTLRSTPGADPSDLAAALYELANANFYAGHLDVSESLSQRTLTLHRELYGNAHPLVADDLINLGPFSTSAACMLMRKRSIGRRSR